MTWIIRIGLVHHAILAAWITFMCFDARSGRAQEPQRSSETGQVVVERDLASGTIRIQIPSRDGRVAWADVLKTLMLVGKLAPEALEDRLPKGEMDLSRPGTSFTIAGLNLWLNPDISLRRVRGENGMSECLLITVDEDAIVARRREMARQFRQDLFAENPELAKLRLGLTMSRPLDQAVPGQPVVVVVHGLNSSPQRFEPLANALTARGYLSGTYSYPDDQPIADSAAQLSRDLKRIREQFPSVKIAIVAHSMGGLVSRSVIEDPELDAGNVSHLIMLATPNQGSLLANLSLGFDMLDDVAEEATRDEVSRFYAMIEDGMSEALDDLRPDSAFLFQLNQRKRNPSVRYSLFLGTGGLLAPDDMDELKKWWNKAKEESRVVALLAPRIDETLVDLDEVVRGRGDGVVAVKRGRLEGVDDTIVAEFSHLNVLQGTDRIEGDPIFAMVVERLAK